MSLVFAIQCDDCGGLVMTKRENLDAPDDWEDDREVKDNGVVGSKHTCPDCQED